MIFISNKASYYFQKGMKALEDGKIEKAIKYFRKSSAKKYMKAKEFLAVFEIFHPKEAYEFALSLEELPVEERAYRIGVEYINSILAEKANGLKWLRFAGKRGIAEADFLLGKVYLEGEVIDKNSFVALEYFEKAAEHEHLLAIKKVADMYNNGQGCDQMDRETALDYYYRSAKLGDIASILEVGSAFQCGDTVIQNDEKAKKWYKIAAKKGSEEGVMAYAKSIAESEPHEAIAWYKQIAEKGNCIAAVEAGKLCESIDDYEEAEAMYRLAIDAGSTEASYFLACLLPDLNVEKHKLLQSSAEMGMVEAQCEFGSYLLTQSSCIADKDIALEWLTKASDKGSIEAQKALYDYYSDEGGEQSKQKALLFLEQGAEQNDEGCAFELGLCYLNGEGCEINTKNAGEWLKRAADLGHRRANYIVGILHEQGIGLWKNHQIAFDRIETAALQDEPGAVYRIGLYYQNGIARSIDPMKAKEYFLRAIELGYQKAFYNLGVLYESGVLGESNIERAVSLYQKASESQIPESFNNLGNLYNNGKGVDQDIEKARFYYKKAIDLNLTVAKYNLALLLFQEGEENDKVAVRLLEEACNEDLEEAHVLLGNYYLADSNVSSIELGLFYLEKIAKKDNTEAIDRLIEYYNQNSNPERLKHWQDIQRNRV